MQNHMRHACITLAIAILLGHVTDATTGQPLPGVHVRVSGAKATVKTNASGAYRLVGIKPGAHILTIVSDDVPTQHRRVTVRATTTVLDITACSTTLDYSCGQARDGPGPGF